MCGSSPARKTNKNETSDPAISHDVMRANFHYHDMVARANTIRETMMFRYYVKCLTHNTQFLFGIGVIITGGFFTCALNVGDSIDTTSGILMLTSIVSLICTGIVFSVVAAWNALRAYAKTRRYGSYFGGIKYLKSRMSNVYFHCPSLGMQLAIREYEEKRRH